MPDALKRFALDDDTFVSAPGSAALNVTRGSGTTPSLTKDYDVNRPANHQSVDEQSPIFLVISHKRNFEESISSKNGSSNLIHFTHMRILDGSSGVMIGRSNMNLAHDGSKLRAGDVFQLHTSTPLTYVSSKGSKGVNQQSSPAIVIHVYSKIGYAPLPRPLNDSMTCVKATL